MQKSNIYKVIVRNTIIHNKVIPSEIPSFTPFYLEKEEETAVTIKKLCKIHIKDNQRL